MRNWIAFFVFGLALLAPTVSPAQGLPASAVVGIAGGSAVGGLGPLGGLAAPVAGPLIGGLVPLLGGLENFPCFLCAGAKVQPKDNDDALQQFHTGVRGFYGFNTELIVGAPFDEQGALTPENTEQVFFLQMGPFDLTVNPDTNEVTAGFITAERSNLQLFDVLPTGPVSKTDFRKKIGDLTRQ